MPFARGEPGVSLDAADKLAKYFGLELRLTTHKTATWPTPKRKKKTTWELSTEKRTPSGFPRERNCSPKVASGSPAGSRSRERREPLRSLRGRTGPIGLWSRREPTSPSFATGAGWFAKSQPDAAMRMPLVRFCPSWSGGLNW